MSVNYGSRHTCEKMICGQLEIHVLHFGDKWRQVLDVYECGREVNKVTFI